MADDASPVQSDVTVLLQRYRDGDSAAGDRLMEVVYSELRRTAGRLMRGERQDHTMQPTVLVHEAWLRLARGPLESADRKRFFGLAARVMRQILVDHARNRRASKRGGDQERTMLDEALAWFESRDLDVIALNDALERLAKRDERMARVVELRFFGSLTVAETANLLGLTVRQVDHAWSLARAILRRDLHGG